MKKVLLGLVIALGIFGSHIAHAHEVYVLDHKEISSALQAPSLDILDTIKDHAGQFVSWGIGILALIVIILLISVNRMVERAIDPYLFKLKRIAPHIAQITLGAALFSSGYYNAVFGIELPLALIFEQYALLASIFMEIIGLMLILGIFPRTASFFSLILFMTLVFEYGIYLLNYLTYAGEALAILLFGPAYINYRPKNLKSLLSKELPKSFHKYKFIIIRVFFGTSLIFASVYAKWLHGQLAIETVNKYHLTNYFPFDPAFLVLGAMLLEISLGLFFILGFEIRFASIFFLIFLTLSLFFFGEAVWPHIILIGTSLAMFTHGYDRFSLSYLFSKKKNLEPVL